MSNFDLNIQNYTQSELQEIFDLKTGYQMNQLLDNEAKLIESIKKDKDVNEKTKNETMKFIEEARNQLVSQVSPEISSFDLTAVPSVVPPSYTNPTHPSRYFPPLENPVTKQNRTMILNVDSRFRENYYTSQSSNFHVTLPMKIDNVVSMKLAAIEFPPTAFFSVNKTSSILYSSMFNKFKLSNFIILDFASLKEISLTTYFFIISSTFFSVKSV